VFKNLSPIGREPDEDFSGLPFEELKALADSAEAASDAAWKTWRRQLPFAALAWTLAALTWAFAPALFDASSRMVTACATFFVMMGALHYAI